MKSLLTQIHNGSFQASNRSNRLTNINCSLIATCTPSIMMSLLQEEPYLATKIITLPIPIQAVEFESYTYNNSLDVEDISTLHFDFEYDDFQELDYHRDYAFWTYLYRNPHSQEFNNSEITNNELYEPYFREQIPKIFIKTISQIQVYEKHYLKALSQGVESSTIFPQQITDIYGALLPSVFEAEDIYRHIKQIEKLLNMGFFTNLPSIINKLIDTKYIRVFSVAFAFTVRKQMLDMQRIDSTFEWDLTINYQMAKAAFKFVSLCDEYTYLLYKTSNNKQCSNI